MHVAAYVHFMPNCICFFSALSKSLFSFIPNLLVCQENQDILRQEGRTLGSIAGLFRQSHDICVSHSCSVSESGFCIAAHVRIPVHMMANNLVSDRRLPSTKLTFSIREVLTPA